MAMTTISSIRAEVRRHLPEAERLLCDLIRFPSLPGQEHEEMLFLAEAFARAGIEVEKVPLSDAIREDPDYSDPVPGLRYDGRFNLRVVRRGRGGRSVVFNAHTDVVPPSDGMPAPWDPRREDGRIYGRGACDDKGQLATLWLVFRAIEALKLDLAGDVIGHLVVEEENGGNGSLAMARRGEQADGCVVMEASENRVHTSIRGAVWFRLELEGKAGHSGQAGQTRSALLMARDAMGILERYHADLLKRSRGFPLFDPVPNPMPLTFGRMESGNWPAAAPSRAVIEGVLGLLPNVTKEDVCREMEQALRQCGDEFLASHFRLGFMYRHDSSVLDPAHALPKTLIRAGALAGLSLEVGGMTASCDAWLYNNQLGIPTVVYGPGSLKVAHSRDENIAVEDVAGAAEALVAFAADWCRQR
jgi:acetylornithine deacetylase